MVDVNGDGFLSPVDALTIINRLNRVSAEGENSADEFVLPENSPAPLVDQVLTERPIRTTNKAEVAASVLFESNSSEVDNASNDRKRHFVDQAFADAAWDALTR